MISQFRSFFAHPPICFYLLCFYLDASDADGSIDNSVVGLIPARGATPPDGTRRSLPIFPEPGRQAVCLPLSKRANPLDAAGLWRRDVVRGEQRLKIIGGGGCFLPAVFRRGLCGGAERHVSLSREAQVV